MIIKLLVALAGSIVLFVGAEIYRHSVWPNSITHVVKDRATGDAKNVVIDENASYVRRTAVLHNGGRFSAKRRGHIYSLDLAGEDNALLGSGAALFGEGNFDGFPSLKNTVAANNSLNEAWGLAVVLNKNNKLPWLIRGWVDDVGKAKGYVSAERLSVGEPRFVERFAGDARHSARFPQRFKDQSNAANADDDPNHADPQNRISPTRHIELGLKIAFGVLSIVTGFYLLSNAGQARAIGFDCAAYVIGVGVICILVGCAFLGGAIFMVISP